MTTIQTERIAYRIATQLRRGDQGHTASVVVGVPNPTEGYAVSLPGHEGITEYVAPPEVNGLPWTNIYAEWIQAYADQHAARLALPNHYLGVWVDGDKLYADVTRVIPDLDTAVREAVKADQLAIYNLGTGQEIQTAPGRRSTLTEEQSKADAILQSLVDTAFDELDKRAPFDVIGAAEYDAMTDALAPLSWDERAKADSGQPIKANALGTAYGARLVGLTQQADVVSAALAKLSVAEVTALQTAILAGQ